MLSGLQPSTLKLSKEIICTDKNLISKNDGYLHFNASPKSHSYILDNASAMTAKRYLLMNSTNDKEDKKKAIESQF